MDSARQRRRYYYHLARSRGFPLIKALRLAWRRSGRCYSLMAPAAPARRLNVPLVTFVMGATLGALVGLILGLVIGRV